MVVKGGRAFTEYLARPALLGEQLHLHLLLLGQRVAAAPVASATSPSFRAEAVIQLPAPPADASGMQGGQFGMNGSPAKNKERPPWVFAAAAEADVAAAAAEASSAQQGTTTSAGNTTANVELQYLLQLRERLHVLVVSSCPSPAPEDSSYSGCAAGAAAAVAEQQQQQQQNASTTHRLQQLCCRQQLCGVGELDWRKVLSRRKGPYITLVELRPGRHHSRLRQTAS